MWRTSPTVIINWRAGQLTAENYLVDTVFEITQDVLLVLSMCSLPKSTEELTQNLGDIGYDITAAELHSQLSALCTQSLLQDIGVSTQPDLLQNNISWSNWGPEAQYFHFITKDAPYFESSIDEQAFVTEISTTCPPPLFKRYQNASRIPLPRVAKAPERDFTHVLQTRRSTREFNEDPLPLKDFAAVLHYAFAPQAFIDAGPFGVLPQRNYANAGARSEMEIYINVLKVEGLDQGLYHYNVIEHSLEYLRAAVNRDEVSHLTYQQSMCADAPIGIFVTAVVDRMGHKYRHPRALRVIYYDVGHLGQTFALVATLYGFGPFQTAAIRDREIETLLGLDGISETALYYLGMGIPTTVARNTAQPASLAGMQKTTLFQVS